MSTEANKALVRRYVETVWNQGDASVIDELVAPDYIQHAQGVPQGSVGVKQFSLALRVAFPDIHNTIEDMIAEGDKVVWRSTIRGTHTGPFRGIPPTGKTIQLKFAEVFEMRDGKIKTMRAYWDTATLMRQLGLL